MMSTTNFRTLWFLCLLLSCGGAKKSESTVDHPSDLPRVTIGAEQLFAPKYFAHIEDKRIGLITNHTGVLPDGQHVIDVLFKHPQVALSVLFGPEHGLRGEADQHVDDGTDAKTGLKIISLYGKTRQPTAEMLAEVDVLVFDIQDIGARYYTYIKTLLLVQEAAAEHQIPLLVLDRPNPIGGGYVDGPVAPIAAHGDIPITHGMTVGELALLFNGYRKEAGLETADLTVIPMKNYTRYQWFDQTGLPWIKPSPNMLTLNTAVVYPATCLIEGTNVSDGRGTLQPFEQIGAPWIDGERLAEHLNSYNLDGIVFRPTHFTPESTVDGITIYPPKFLGEQIEGVALIITDRTAFNSAQAGIYILHALKTLYPEHLEFRAQRLDGLLDTPNVRLQLEAGASPETIVNSWKTEVERFKEKRKAYLLY